MCSGAGGFYSNGVCSAAPTTQIINRVSLWQPVWMHFGIPIRICCPSPGTCDWSYVDAVIASNRIWQAPYETKVKAYMDWGSYVTLNYRNGIAIYSTNTTYDIMPLWFYNLARRPQDLSGGAMAGAELFDAQVPAASRIVSNLLVHEAGRISVLGLTWEPDWGTNYAIPLAMVASSVVNVARSTGVSLAMGEFGQPVYGVFTSYCGYYNGSNWYDAIVWHDDHWISWPPDRRAGPNSPPNLRYDQLFDRLASLGKMMMQDYMEFFYCCDPTEDALYADRIVKGILMMRKSGVAVIAPNAYPYASTCAPDNVLSNNFGGAYTGYVDNAMTASGVAISNLLSLIGNSACSASSVHYPYYCYQFGSNTFAWIAEGYPSEAMTLSGWASGPTYVRDATAAPTNALGNSPIVLSGTGEINTGR